MRDAVIQPLSHVYGISRKMLNMSLSILFVNVGAERER